MGEKENQIRWRWKEGEDGKREVHRYRDYSSFFSDETSCLSQMESNSRLVKWSDGTYSLYVGNRAFLAKPEKTRRGRNFVYVHSSEAQEEKVLQTRRVRLRKKKPVKGENDDEETDDDNEQSEEEEWEEMDEQVEVVQDDPDKMPFDRRVQVRRCLGTIQHFLKLSSEGGLKSEVHQYVTHAMVRAVFFC